MKQKHREKEQATSRMRKWLDNRKSAQASSIPSSARWAKHQIFSIEDLCRTYLLVSSAAVPNDLKRDEMVIS